MRRRRTTFTGLFASRFADARYVVKVASRHDDTPPFHHRETRNLHQKWPAKGGQMPTIVPAVATKGLAPMNPDRNGAKLLAIPVNNPQRRSGHSQRWARSRSCCLRMRAVACLRLSGRGNCRHAPSSGLFHRRRDSQFNPAQCVQGDKKASPPQMRTVCFPSFRLSAILSRCATRCPDILGVRIRMQRRSIGRVQ